MIQKGFCTICGRRLGEEPDRSHNEMRHDDCERQSTPKILKNLGISEKNLTDVLEGRGILTTDKYWDCECIENYIHPKDQKACSRCLTTAENQPDSRISEVLTEGFVL